MAFERSIASKLRRIAKKARTRIGDTQLAQLASRTTKNLKKGVRNVEVGVAKSGRKIAKSQVVKSAKNVTRGLKTAESKVAQSTAEVTKGVAKSQIGQGVKRFAHFVKHIRALLVGIAKSFHAGCSRVAERVVPKPIRVGASKLTNRVWKLFSSFGSFIVTWFKSRHYRQLIAALPAVLLAVPLLYFVVRIPFHGAARKSAYYRRQAAAALDDKNYDKANLLFRKLQQLGGLNEATLFQSAFHKFEQGEKAEAVELMQKLAPLDSDEPGFDLAHVWLAQWFLSDNSIDANSRMEIVQKHLKYALRRNPENPIARAIRANAFRQNGQWEDAIAELEAVVNQLPMQGLSLAELYRQQGRVEDATATLQRIDEQYSKRSDIEGGSETSSLIAPPNARPLTATDFVVWARTKELLGDLSQAERLYVEGTSRFSDDESLKEQAVNYFLAMSDLAEGPSEESAKVYIDYLVRAVKISQEDSTIHARLAKLTKVKGPIGRVATERIIEMLHDGSAPNMLWSVFGTALAEDGKLEESIKFLAPAVEKNPNHALTLNNTAWVRLQLNLDLDETIKLSNRALELEPENSIFLETRGQVYLRQKNWAKAINDFEFAINGFEQPNPQTHQSLAFAYEQMGQTDLASAHRKISAWLLGKY